MTPVTIFQPAGADGYELCHPADDDDFERINRDIDGAARLSTWRPLRMRLIQADGDQLLARSDSPWLGAHALIFRGTAIAKLGTMLTDYGELLPAATDADVYIYNPTRIIDALDEEASSVLRLPDRRIIAIDRHVFRSSAIENIHVFKIPTLRVSQTFVSQHFVQRWEASGLRGLEFRRLWSS